MARGWESKSVEDQQAEFNKTHKDKETKRRSPQDIERAREVKTLQLTRSYVQHQFDNSQNERHRELLKHELQHLDEQIAALQNGNRKKVS